MLKRRQPTPGEEGPDDEIECDGPTCNVRKPKRKMQPMEGGVRVCSDRCHNLWVRRYRCGEDVSGF